MLQKNLKIISKNEHVSPTGVVGTLQLREEPAAAEPAVWTVTIQGPVLNLVTGSVCTLTLDEATP